MARRTEDFARKKTEPAHKINDLIDAGKIRLIGPNSENYGEVTIDIGLQEAEKYSLDLVEISPNTDLPVCKIMDYGKFKYQSQKKAAEAKKKQKVIGVKEIKMRPNIDTHDYEVKLKNMKKFIEFGDKVKISLMFRGREMSHSELGVKLFDRIKDDTDELAKVELEPKFEGRQIIMVLAPR
ncbi:MAG: translation initiation factor IF-3 [Rhodobiaceae bacterium]|nr:translation initiation factor IF-3 [Rhodobiaceae bacterium]MAU57335.1 translation initiation factor IF-3 [Rhodobiaceae bacterium]OUT82036.1 MAG: translation initiation factor IF-3 [Rhizobiales bacterium TMED28]RZO33946.1 MAG: translation initiation factor IF-3 [Hyphomicrobiales bacterium]